MLSVMLLFIEQNAVTKKTDLIIQITLKKLQKNNKINYGMKVYDHIDHKTASFKSLWQWIITKL